MNINDAKIASEKLGQFRNLKQRLKEAEDRLHSVNAAGRENAGKTYPVRVILKAGNRHAYNDRDVEISIPLSFGVVQQHVLNEVNGLRREIALLGIEGAQ